MLGRHRELLAELADLTGTHPAREHLAELHMRALYATGRTAEALAAYARLRTHLADQLGLDPAPALQRLHRSILRREPLPDSPPPGTRSDVRPAQLPPDLPGFAGRAGQLEHLDRLLAGRTSAVVISAITGTAGVGKTSLAIHWAHRVRDRFPDGQLYLNLRGFDPAGSAVTPAEAVRGILDALGVAPQRIPDGLDAQVGLYRSLLSGKRLLILLDNARDPEQVRPLLPGSPGCLAVVTSRNRLTGLVAIDGAQPVPLDLLTTGEARQLLAARLGADRVAAEPDAVDALIELCARLPLALAVAAAQAAAQPEVPLATVAARLRSTRSALDAVTGDDRATDIRAVFACSYQTLGEPAARLFRLLGLHPGRDIPAAAAASLAGVPPAEIGVPLGELTRAHLVTQPAPGRYTCHDLLRAYAGELAGTHDPAPVRDTAHAAALVDPHRRDPIGVAPAAPGVSPEPVTDHQQAMAWFTTEHPTLLAVVRLAAAAGLDAQVWQLGWALANFLYRQGHWQDFVAVQEDALAAATRLGDGSKQAAAHRFLGYALSRLGRDDEAYAHLRKALDVHRDLDDPVGHAYSHVAISEAWYDRKGRYREALAHAEKAVELHRRAGNTYGTAGALDATGWLYAVLGDYGQALARSNEALALHRELGNRQGEAAAWEALGYAYHHLGDHAHALTCYQRSLELFHDLGDLYYEATLLNHLGETHHAAGDPGAARSCWQRALDIFTELEHPEAVTVRTRLDELDAVRA